MYLKGLVTAVLSHSILENGRVLSAPSLHRESTDSLIIICIRVAKVGGLTPLTI